MEIRVMYMAEWVMWPRSTERILGATVRGTDSTVGAVHAHHIRSRSLLLLFHILTITAR